MLGDKLSVIIAINNNITYNKTGEYYTVKLFDVKVALTGKIVNYKSRFLCLLTGVPQSCMLGTIIFWDVYYCFTFSSQLESFHNE